MKRFNVIGNSALYEIRFPQIEIWLKSFPRRVQQHPFEKMLQQTCCITYDASLFRSSLSPFRVSAHNTAEVAKIIKLNIYGGARSSYLILLKQLSGEWHRYCYAGSANLWLLNGMQLDYFHLMMSREISVAQLLLLLTNRLLIRKNWLSYKWSLHWFP